MQQVACGKVRFNEGHPPPAVSDQNDSFESSSIMVSKECRTRHGNEDGARRPKPYLGGPKDGLVVFSSIHGRRPKPTKWLVHLLVYLSRVHHRRPTPTNLWLIHRLVHFVRLRRRSSRRRRGVLLCSRGCYSVYCVETGDIAMT